MRTKDMSAISKCPSNVHNQGVYFCFHAKVYSRLSDFRVNYKKSWRNCFL